MSIAFLCPVGWTGLEDCLRLSGYSFRALEVDVEIAMLLGWVLVGVCTPTSPSPSIDRR